MTAEPGDVPAAASSAGGAGAGFRHEALLYEGERELVDWAARFLGDAVALGEPALAVVSRRKIELPRAVEGGNVLRLCMRLSPLE